MSIFSGLFHSRDKPQNCVDGGWSFLFGGTTSGKTVNERMAMQSAAVYACVRILADVISPCIPFITCSILSILSIKPQYIRVFIVLACKYYQGVLSDF